MPRVRLFAAARDAAGTGRDVLPGATVGEVLAAAVERYGDDFALVLDRCRVWVDGEPADVDDAVADAAEVAVLPPVSGGAVGSGTDADHAAVAAPAATARAGRPTGPTRPPAVRDLAGDPTLLVERLFEPVDTAGNKALLGLLWVLVQALALLLGPVALAVVFGLVAAVAGLHAAKAWRPAGQRPSRAVAGLAPLIIPLAAAVDPAAAGVALLVAVVASVAVGAGGVRQPRLAGAGTTLRCWLGPTMAATSVVLVAQI